MGKGSSEPKVNYQSSPEQRQLLSQIMPLVGGLASYGMNNMTYGGTPTNTGVGNYTAPAPQFGQQQMAAQPAQSKWNGPTPYSPFKNLQSGTVLYPGGATGNNELPGNPYLIGGGVGSFTGSQMQPMNPGMGGMGGTTGGVTSLGQPQAPTIPSMGGVLSGVPYNPPSMGGVYSDVPMYNLPNAPMPTADWYNSMAPEVMAGLWSPYEDAAKRLAEQLNYQGVLGSGGQYTGNAAAGFGELYGDAAKNVGLSAWQMSQPGLMADYASQLQRNQTGYQNLLTERGTDYQNLMNKTGIDYQNLLTERGTDYQNKANQLQQNYQGDMMAWQMPYSLIGMTPQLMPTGMVSEGSNPMGGMFSGGLSGALAGAMIPGLGPMAGGGLGALAGLFGGK